MKVYNGLQAGSQNKTERMIRLAGKKSASEMNTLIQFLELKYLEAGGDAENLR